MTEPTRPWYAWRRVWVVSVWVVMPVHVTWAAEPEVPIEIQHGVLTGTLQNAPLAAVLATIQQHTGMQYVLPDAEASRRISGHFQAIPLPEALRQILLPLNYAIQTDAHGIPQYVRILGTANPTASDTSTGPRRSFDNTEDVMRVTSGGPPLQIVPAREGEGMVILPAETVTMVITPALNSEGMRVRESAE